MGTTCEIAAQMPNGRWRQIHISYDGYISGVGLVLFRDYATPEKVAALLSHDTGAVQLTTDPAEMSWDEWHPREGLTLDELVTEHRYDTSGMDQATIDYYAEHEQTPGFLGLYVHAHGRWAAPRSTDMLRTFVETGECVDVLTKELLIAEGVAEDRFSAGQRPLRPVNVHRGVLSVRVEQDDDGQDTAVMTFVEEIERAPADPEQDKAFAAAHLDVDMAAMDAAFAEEDDDNIWALVPDERFEGVVGMTDPNATLLDLDGRTVEIMSGRSMVSSSFGPGGSSSQSVMTVRRITLVDAPATETTA